MSWEEEARVMVERQIRHRGVLDERLLDALRDTPRHLFVAEDLRGQAYRDGPLPIGFGQTISQPYIVAAMTDLLELRGDERVLEVGCGSGYQAAVLARLVGQVYTVERHAGLAGQARKTLATLGLANVAVLVGDGSAGWPAFAPYNAIVVTAAAPRVLRVVLEQLADDGRLVLPVGGPHGQALERWRRVGEEYRRETVFPVSFVPLRGEEGWSDKEWPGESDS